jgi:3-methyl-2-oxobutanoate hydroxymethyltransferase
VVDIPFGSYQSDPKEALRSAIRIMKESGGHAVKVEGGREIKESIKRILNAGIPVMGHLGLTPQSIYKFGTYTVRAKEEEEAEILKADALLLEKAGCFGIVLEKVPAKLAAEVAASVTIPIIGIGAGNGVDGQVLVTHDMLGMTHEFNPRFLRRYLDMFEDMTGAFKSYITDVKSGDFPNEEEQY